MDRRVSRKQIRSAFASYQADIAAGLFEEVLARNLCVGDFLRVREGYSEIMAIEPVLVGGRRQDYRMTLADGTTCQLYENSTETRKG